MRLQERMRFAPVDLRVELEPPRARVEPDDLLHMACRPTGRSNVTSARSGVAARRTTPPAPRHGRYGACTGRCPRRRRRPGRRRRARAGCRARRASHGRVALSNTLSTRAVRRERHAQVRVLERQPVDAHLVVRVDRVGDGERGCLDQLAVRRRRGGRTRVVFTGVAPPPISAAMPRSSSAKSRAASS